MPQKISGRVWHRSGVFQTGVRLLFGCYRYLLHPLLAVGFSLYPGGCRFTPTCSHYAHQAIATLPLKRAIPLILRRLGQCRPGGAFGYDPVPDPESWHDSCRDEPMSMTDRSDHAPSGTV